MFRHCVMFKFKPDTPANIRADITAQLTLLAQLPMVRGYQFGPDAALAEGNFDFALVADFDDQAGYEAYAIDPQHLAVLKDLLRPNISARAAVQYQLS